jgi:microcystin degradation protein MlrC
MAFFPWFDHSRRHQPRMHAMRLFAASLATETNTFSPLPTSRATFEAAFYARPGSHPDAAKLCTAPLVVARRRATQEGFTLIEGSCFWAEPSGTVDADGYASMKAEILDQLEAALPVDGILMGFHGAMVTEGTPDVEGDMLDAIRALAPDAVIGCEYDPHCHLTARRVSLADVSILFKEYPHTDGMERAEELVTLVLRTIRGQIRPVSSLYDPRMWDFYPTTTEPVRSLVDRLSALETGPILSVSLAHGFQHGDVADMGSRVLVVTDDAKPEGDALAERLGRELWDGRGGWSPRARPLADVLSEVLGAPGRSIVAEPADNAGGGAASDNTATLHALIERGARRTAIAPLWDPGAVAFCHDAGLGRTVPLRVGGKASAGSGTPVDADVTVIGLARDAHQMFGDVSVPLGNTAAIRIAVEGADGIDVVLIEKRTQALGVELFTALGLDPADYDLLVLKSAQHFAAAFGPYADRIVSADTGGACPPDPAAHPYRYVARPLWPLDDEPFQGRLLL